VDRVVGCAPTALDCRRRLVPKKKLLRPVRDERKVRRQLGPIPVVVQGQCRPSEARHRVGPCVGDQKREVDRLLNGQPAQLAVPSTISPFDSSVNMSSPVRLAVLQYLSRVQELGRRHEGDVDVHALLRIEVERLADQPSDHVANFGVNAQERPLLAVRLS
jgi:hypothetical protein